MTPSWIGVAWSRFDIMYNITMMLSRRAHYTEYKILILRVVEVYLSDIVEGRGNAYHISIPFTKIYVGTGVG